MISELSHGILPQISSGAYASLHLLTWCLLITQLVRRWHLSDQLHPFSESLGIAPERASLERMLERLIFEIGRKSAVLAPEMMERQIRDGGELYKVLEQMVQLCRKQLQADSVEFSLFDPETRQFHSSIVLGKPFRLSTAELIGDKFQTNKFGSDGSLVQPIAFAGSILGSIRIGRDSRSAPTLADRQLLSLISLQTGVALINARYTEELLRMKNVSEESIRAKTGFLANLSHELRGPLGIITNGVELLLDGLCGPTNTEQSETLSMVAVNASHLLDLVNDVLDYAKAESGKIHTQAEDLLVDDILEEMCAIVRREAEKKDVQVTMKRSEHILAARSDRRHFRQMLMNLLTNAIKYTEEGGSVSVWAERSAQKRVVIHVEDTGIGIDNEDFPRVFQPFQRIEHRYALVQVGSGLGLSLTKRLVEANGGTIGFESELGKGSHFWIALPATDPIQSTFEPQPKRKKAVDGLGQCIALEISDRHEQDIVRRFLESRNFEVISCQSSDELLELLKTRARVLLCDDRFLDSPPARGLRDIRVSGEGQGFSIMLLSGRAFTFDIEERLRIGVDRVLSKPVSLESLASALSELLSADKQLREKSGAGAPIPRGKLVH